MLSMPQSTPQLGKPVNVKQGTSLTESTLAVELVAQFPPNAETASMIPKPTLLIFQPSIVQTV